jgi:putative peptidoglycan lipid II flippase
MKATLPLRPLGSEPEVTPAGEQGPAKGGGSAPAPGKKQAGGGLRSTLLVSALTMASRLLGLVREQLFAALLGAGIYADAFVVAFRIPNLLRDLFAEGALSAAFVPTFTQVEAEKGKPAAHELANRVIGALLVIVGALTLLGIVFARPLVWALAAGFAKEPGKLELTAYLAQLMMPFLLLLSLAAVMMGMLNARGRFGAPAIAPALFNVAAIGVGAGLKLAGCSPETAVVGWSLGTLLGGLLQFGVQVPQVWRDGYRLWPRFRGLWSDPAIRRIARLMAPATLGLAAVQVNIFINTQFASGEPGANAWLNYAFRLMYLPIGIFGVAIATVTASSLARHAANKDVAQVRSGLAQGLRHVALLTVPSTVGLVVLARPIIALIYEHGRFTADDTAATAVALMGYSVGLYAYSGVKVAAPAFYALDRPRVPLVASASAVLTNLVFNAVAHRWLGYLGLALGTSLGAMLNLLILTRTFRSLTKGAQGPAAPPIAGQFAKVVAASALMGAAVWGAVWAFDRFAGAGAGTAMQLVRVVGGVGLGALVYAGACKALRVGEMDEVLAALRRRRGRRA